MRIRWLLLWLLIATAIISLPVTGYLLVLGSAGNQIASTLALPLGVIQTVVVLWKPVSDWRAARVEGTSSKTNWTERIRAAAVIVAAISGLACIGALVELVVNNIDVDITNDVRVSDGNRIPNGESATVVIPGHPPKRQYVRLKPVLSNPDSTGDCVAPANLIIRPVIDGRKRDGVEGVSGQVIDVSLAHASNTAKLSIEVHQADPQCAVDLRIDGAVLHN